MRDGTSREKDGDEKINFIQKVLILRKRNVQSGTHYYPIYIPFSYPITKNCIKLGAFAIKIF